MERVKQPPNSNPTINCYICKDCKAETITKDIDDGVTPAMIQCPTCKTGAAWSCFYQIDQTLTPEYEWFKPKDPAQYVKIYPKNIRKDMLVHFAKGGLDMRPIVDKANLSEQDVILLEKKAKVIVNRQKRNRKL